MRISPRPRVDRACERCGATFNCVPSSSQRYCGYSCASKSRERATRSAEERFWEKVNKNGPIPAHRPELGPCWEWLGAPMPNGYGKHYVGKSVEEYAHRYAYELLVGPIPEGLELDHLCRNRICVNPGHTEPVTSLVNMLRGEHPSAVAVRTNRCHNGHEFTPENTYLVANGERQCRACNRERAVRYRTAAKERKAA